ncbi:MAG: hypothetical protein JO168_10650 [Solirubrobacterales bacterium]|nr:hypothetical protein [Solirubrobacterales bacterium]MBV9713954.1 hypothetical protein [Solirubrobacterales bacterium]
MADREFELEQEQEAAAEAASIGGRVSSEPKPAEGGLDESRPLVEAGQGEAEGFEESERALIEHASHGDEHAARRAIEDAPDVADDRRAVGAGEPDAEHSSERLDDR